MTGHRAVLIDLDGTLLRSDETLSGYSRQVLEAVQQTDVVLMIVTGRSVAGALKPLADLPLRWPLCAYNGAVVYDPGTERWLRHQTLPEAVAAHVHASFEARALETFVYVEDVQYTRAPRSAEYARLLARFEQHQVVESHDQIPPGPVTRISGFGPGERMDPCRQALALHYSGAIYIECYPLADLPSFDGFTGFWCDIQPACAGKREALIYLEQAHGIPAEQVVAIGDQVNDRPMLEAAGYAAVMGNAPQALRAGADRVLDHHDADGAARFLAELFL